MAAEEDSPLRLLSLDGGGIRGLSTLIILEHLMQSINHASPPKPCEVFDLIGGTSTGGLIAIMLGRLEMDVASCINAYTMMSESIFQPKRSKFNIISRTVDLWNLRGRFNTGALTESIKGIVIESGHEVDAKLLDHGRPLRCKAFVCAVRGETVKPVRLRTYRNTGVREVNCTIWEAGRATSAAPSFFDPIVIGPFREKFLDGGTSRNNPVREVISEAREIWPNFDERGGCILSIGTGQPGVKSFGKNASQLGKSLIKLATETEETAQAFEEDYERSKANFGYFRLNVTKGLEDIGLEEYAEKAAIVAATKDYLTGLQVSRLVTACKRMLSRSNQAGSGPGASAERRIELKRQIPKGGHAHIESEFWAESRDGKATGVLSPDHPWSNAVRRSGSSALHCRSSFLTMDIDEHFQTIRKADGDTFKWVLDHPSFVQLMRPAQNGILHIVGKPGCGKSVLSVMLYHASTAQGLCIFFACNDRINSRRTPSAILSSLISQLLSARISLLEQGPKDYYIQKAQRMEPSLEWSLTQLKTIFKNIVKLAYDRVFCVIDGLDECDSGPEREAFTEFLDEIVQECSTTESDSDHLMQRVCVKFIVTSRPYYDISFQCSPSSKIDLDAEEAVEKDLTAFTSAAVQRLLKKRPAYGPYRESIQGKVIQRANNGMYLMVHLLMDLLYRLSDSSPESIRETLSCLPVDLADVYKRIWSRIEPSNLERARTIMNWILGAFRPLNVMELESALAAERALQSAQTVGAASKYRSADTKGDLERLFGPLVRIDATVELIHQTVKDYFLMEAKNASDTEAATPVLLPDVNIHIATVCLLTLGPMLARTDGSKDYREETPHGSLDTIIGVPAPVTAPAGNTFQAYALTYAKAHRLLGIERGESPEKLADLDSLYESLAPRPQESSVDELIARLGESLIWSSELRLSFENGFAEWLERQSVRTLPPSPNHTESFPDVFGAQFEP